MNSNIIIVLMVIFCSVTFGYQAISEVKTHPEHPGKCWMKETNTAYSVGDSFKLPNTCEQLTCRGDYRLQISGCGVEIYPDTCVEVPQDFTKDYPACCDKYEC